MCGICGIVYADRGRHVDPMALMAMRDLMTHRGPDDAGSHVERNVGLGHRRLSIIDPSGGHQPMSSEGGYLWIVYNGEIYNFLGLKEELLSKGHVFTTNSDTEVILHAYEEFGTGCLERLRGMFSFAIWDGRRNILFAARDRLGIKPFYYTEADGAFLFSSEIKSLLLNPKVRREINEEGLYAYLTLRYVPGPHTLFKNIRKLLPGHCLLVENGKTVLRQYWDLPAERDAIPKCSPLKREETFLQLFEECVRMRLMSEVPLGVFLSGGIDSSAVAAAVRKSSNGSVRTFSVGYDQDFGTNEFEYAAMVANALGTDHHECRISSQDFHQLIPRLVWHLDEPVSDPAAIPLYLLSRLSRDHVTVVLSGEGADEILGGYSIYRKMLALERFHHLPLWLRESMLRGLSNLKGHREKWARYIQWARLPLQKRYRGVSGAFTAASIEKLRPFHNGAKEWLDKIYDGLFARARGLPLLDQMLYVDMKTWLPDDLLLKADKMTMAASQELRVPFLDHKLVEFAFSLPPEDKICRGTTKSLLKRSVREVLPSAVVQREKKGFPVPIEQWFRGDLYETSNEILLSNSSSCRDLFDISYVSLLLEKHKRGEEDLSGQIWNLMILEYWYKMFVKPVQPVEP